MMRMTSRSGALALALIATILAAGCGTTEPARFYLLVPEADAGPAGEPALEDLDLILEPVDLPDFLDRPQIVLHEGGPGLTLAEFDRWGESLQDNLSRVISENLSGMLGTDRIRPGPGAKGGPDTYRLSVRILDLSGKPGGRARLDARYALLRPDGMEPLHRGRARIEEPAGETFEDLVLAWNRTVNRLSRALADTVREHRILEE